MVAHCHIKKHRPKEQAWHMTFSAAQRHFITRTSAQPCQLRQLSSYHVLEYIFTRAIGEADLAAQDLCLDPLGHEQLRSNRQSQKLGQIQGGKVRLR